MLSDGGKLVRFALVVVIGPPSSRTMAVATGLEEILTPILPVFVVSDFEIDLCAGKVIVKGPGQKERILSLIHI